MGTLLFSSGLFPNQSPELSVIDAEIQYNGSKKKNRKKNSFSKEIAILTLKNFWDRVRTPSKGE